MPEPRPPDTHFPADRPLPATRVPAGPHKPPFHRSGEVQLAGLLGLLWLGLFGGEQLIAGTIAVVATTSVARTVVPLRSAPSSFPGLAQLLLYFLHQSLAGGIDVAWRAFHPRCPLSPGVWRYQLRLAEGQGRMLFIGCVGIIPGTVGRRLDGDTLWVHSIAGDPQQQLMALEQRVGQLYKIALMPARKGA